jgi:hypothetical protein
MKKSKTRIKKQIKRRDIRRRISTLELANRMDDLIELTATQQKAIDWLNLEWAKINKQLKDAKLAIADLEGGGLATRNRQLIEIVDWVCKDRTTIAAENELLKVRPANQTPYYAELNRSF